MVVSSLSGRLAELRWDDALGAGQLETRTVDDELLEQVWGPVVHRLILATRNNHFELTLTRGTS